MFSFKIVVSPDAITHATRRAPPPLISVLVTKFPLSGVGQKMTA